jgi:hypothetical protein
MGLFRKQTPDERGFILVLGLLLLLVATLLAISGVNSTTYEARISGNRRISEQAFYVAEAGIHEFMGRFGGTSSGGTFDPDPSNPDWKLFLALNTERARSIGYRSTSTQSLTASLQDRLDFAVEIRHQVDSTNHVIMKEGYPIYAVTSHGYAPDRGHRIIEAEVHRGTPVDPPAALYSKAPIRLRGSSTYITGIDQCGSDHRPGIMTMSSSLTQSGNPLVAGTTPAVTNSQVNLPLSEMIGYLKEWADFEYHYSGDRTLTGYSDAWGVPMGSGTETPLSYPEDARYHAVYFNMEGTTLKLAGGSHGAGLLLVDGNLEINGGFRWYGVIIVKGALTYSGGGEKNITGAVLSGDSATLEVDVGGNIGILYCSEALRRLREWAPPLRIALWREVY